MKQRPSRRREVQRKTRSDAKATARPPGSSRRPPRGSPPGSRETDNRGDAGIGREVPPPHTADAVSDFVRSLLDPSNPFARMYAVFLRQLFEPQRLFLESLQKALGERSLNEAAEDHLRRMTKAMMGAYLDVTKSMPLHRERLADMRTNGIQTYLEAVDGLLRKLEHPRA